MTEAEHIAITGRTLVLFDGVCVLCNRTVRFLLNRDPADNLRFAPTQSPLAHEFLTRFGLDTPPEGVIVICDALTPAERLYTRSDASAEALRHIKNPYPALGTLLRFVPRWLREFGYGIVARNRYRIFGRYDTCPIPTEGQRSRILGV